MCMQSRHAHTLSLRVPLKVGQTPSSPGIRGEAGTASGSCSSFLSPPCPSQVPQICFPSQRGGVGLSKAGGPQKETFTWEEKGFLFSPVLKSMTDPCVGGWVSQWDCSDLSPPAARGLVSLNHLLPTNANWHLNSFTAIQLVLLKGPGRTLSLKMKVAHAVTCPHPSLCMQLSLLCWHQPALLSAGLPHPPVFGLLFRVQLSLVLQPLERIQEHLSCTFHFGLHFILGFLEVLSEAQKSVLERNRGFCPKAIRIKWTIH